MDLLTASGFTKSAKTVLINQYYENRWCRLYENNTKSVDKLVWPSGKALGWQGEGPPLHSA